MHTIRVEPACLQAESIMPSVAMVASRVSHDLPLVNVYSFCLIWLSPLQPWTQLVQSVLCIQHGSLLQLSEMQRWCKVTY